MFYSKHLSASLTAVIEDAISGDPREALNLFQELALARVAITPIVEMYAVAESATADNENDKKKIGECKTAAAALMCDALKSVMVMCEAAARVENQGKDKYSVHSLKAIVNQIVRIAHQVFQDMPEKAEEFKRLVDEEIRMPNEVTGTNLTPDRDVLDMDETIPTS